MKKVKKLTLLVVLLSTICVKSQILSQVGEFKSVNLIGASFSSEPLTDCFYIEDSSNLKIYDLSFQLQKNVWFQSIERVSYVHKNVFTKSGKYEFIISLHEFDKENTYLCNEDGTVLFNFGETDYVYIIDKYLFVCNLTPQGKIFYTTKVYIIDNYDVSVEKKQKTTSSRVFPNPATMGFINIEYKIIQPETLEIFDSSGKVLQTAVLTPGNTSYRMNFNQPAGIYFYRHQTGSGTFIVQ